MLDSIRYSLANVLNFEGRDARSTFWFYILFLVVAQFVITMVASIPMYVAIFSTVFDAATVGQDPDMVVRGMAQEMSGQIRTLTYVGFALTILTAILMLASFVRRLHDAGYTGWIAAIPILTQLFAQIYTLSFLDRIEEVTFEAMTQGATGSTGEQFNPYAVQAEMGVLGLVGWIGYLVVIGFGVLKSQEGPNQYGDAPVRF